MQALGGPHARPATATAAGLGHTLRTAVRAKLLQKAGVGKLIKRGKAAELTRAERAARELGCPLECSKNIRYAHTRCRATVVLPC